MLDIITRAGCFVSIILIGYILRKINFFDEHAFKVLSKIVVRITLPAAIVHNFIGKEIDASLFLLALIGFGGGAIYMIMGYILSRKAGKEQQAFDMLNASGYNIGNFTLPFVQSFLGSSGVIAASIFDVGNAFICLGGAFSVASMVKGNEGSFSFKKILSALFKSIAFDCYITMAIVSLLKIPVPSPIASLAEIMGSANAFLAMLMIGVGFKLNSDRTQIRTIIRILSLRYIVAGILAAGCYFFLPFSLEIRHAVMIILFSPIAAAVPAFTSEMNSDAGLSSAVNSMSIICSIIIIVSMLTFMI